MLKRGILLFLSVFFGYFGAQLAGRRPGRPVGRHVVGRVGVGRDGLEGM